MYRLWLLLLHLSGKTGTFRTHKDGKRCGETENEREGGEEIMSQTRVINGPHISTERTTSKVMMHVVDFPDSRSFGSHVTSFGIRAFYLTGFSVGVCVLTEYIWQKLTKKQITAGDFSAVVTGILMAFNMPVTVPVWVLVAADVFSILIVKQMFGGIGNNFVNPALMGRLLVMVAWPGAVMQYVAPQTITTDAVSAADDFGNS